LLVAPREGAYRIERWNTVGELLQIYERRASWFPPNVVADHGVPIILGMHEDTNGLLWVLHVTFDPRPADAQLGKPRMPTGHTIIDVLDLKERRIVTTARCECLGGEIIGSPSYWHYAEDSQGNPRFTIWTFRLAR
jgi:hypothetical protein